MKNTSILIFLLLTFSLSCKQESPDDDGNPDSDTWCVAGLLTAVHAEEHYSGGRSARYSSVYEYTFDAQNRIKAFKINYSGDYLPGAQKVYEYTYDTDGYLISRICLMHNYSFLGTNRHNVSDEYYDYRDGKLSKIRTQNKEYTGAGSRLTVSSEVVYSYDGSERITSVGNYRFEYDSNGNVVKFNDGSPVQYQLANGRIVKAGGGDTYYEYQYSPSGQLLKELFTNTTTRETQVLTWELGQGKNPFTALGRTLGALGLLPSGLLYSAPGINSLKYTSFKGFPVLPEITGNFVNCIKSVSEEWPGIIPKYQQNSSNIVYNSDGYPQRIVYETRALIPGGFGSTTLDVSGTTTYEYCQ
jgi:hypothetical protein